MRTKEIAPIIVCGRRVDMIYLHGVLQLSIPQQKFQLVDVSTSLEIDLKVIQIYLGIPRQWRFVGLLQASHAHYEN